LAPTGTRERRVVKFLRRVLTRIRRDGRGVTALEYTLITVVIGAAVLSGLDTYGNSLSDAYTTIADALATHAANAASAVGGS
jgi:Flp pilus assembly pilin Flp